jgi:bacillithiol system protein YtxJ
MHWNTLTDLHQLDEIVEISQNQPVVIFKHSTRCSISSTALSRFERAWGTTENTAYYLDLIAYRPISLEIAEKFGVQHQSPQVLVIHKGTCTYSATHWDISVDELKPYLSE